MATRRLAVLFLCLAVAITLPSIAFAAVNATGQGLVSCGVSSDPNVATECEACNLVQLVQNVITFLIMIAVPLAMGMFAYAGFLYFTSGMGGTENISKAKKIFSSSAIGFALALASWLIVNTVLYTVLDHDTYPNSSWFKIDCSNYRPRAGNIGDVIIQHLDLAPAVNVQAPVGLSYSCANYGPDYELTTSGGKQVCMNNRGISKPATVVGSSFISGSGVLCPDGNLACSPAALRAAGVGTARANAMSCIAVTESSGNPNAPTPSGSTACGTWQILEKTNWSDPSLHSGNCNVNTNCHNAECNMQTAILLGNRAKAAGRSYYSDWTCPGCNAKAAACVIKYDPGN